MQTATCQPNAWAWRPIKRMGRLRPPGSQPCSIPFLEPVFPRKSRGTSSVHMSTTTRQPRRFAARCPRATLDASLPAGNSTFFCPHSLSKESHAIADRTVAIHVVKYQTGSNSKMAPRPPRFRRARFGPLSPRKWPPVSPRLTAPGINAPIGGRL
jgi:hypothetical protein